MANLVPILLNNVFSTVQAGSSAIGSSSATGVNVATGDGANFGAIATNQFIPAAIADTSGNVTEFVYITARSTDALTVQRAAEESGRYPASTTTIQSGYKIFATTTVATLTSWAAQFARPALLDRSTDALNNYTWMGWTIPANGADTATGGSCTSANMYFTPMLFARRTVLDRVVLTVATAGTTGTVSRVGLYTADPVTFAPTTLVTDFGSVATDTTGTKEITTSQTVDPGLWWFAVAQSNTVTYSCPVAGASPPYSTNVWSPGNQPYVTPNVSGTGVASGSMPSSAGTIAWANAGISRATCQVRVSRTAN